MDRTPSDLSKVINDLQRDLEELKAAQMSIEVTTGMIADNAVTDSKMDWDDMGTLFYKVGDTFSYATPSGSVHLAVGGFLTSGNKDLCITLPVSKRLDNVSSVTITTFKGNARCNGSYLSGLNSGGDAASLATSISALVNKECSTVDIVFTRSSGWGATNNAPVSMQMMEIGMEFA